MYKIIGAASGWGAQLRACEEGPQILMDEGILALLEQKGFKVSEWKMLYPDKKAKDVNIPLESCLPLIHSFNLRLAEEVERALDAKDFPIVLGGDHSIAVGTWNGVYRHLKKRGELPWGLIWIDAHMDSHTPETSPSGAWHGMPLAALMGYGDPLMAELKQKGPLLFPENLCLIGVRSFEEGEAELLRRVKVRVFFADEVRKRGMEDVMREAVKHVSREGKPFGVSLDVDVIDPKEAPGVGSPEERGIHEIDLLKGIALLKGNSRLKAFELVEYNPAKNHHKMTAKICFDVLSTLMMEERAWKAS